MKIVLTTLPTEGQYINWTTSEKLAPTKVKYIPLGILSLASNITGNHEVIILDPSLHGWTIDDTIEQIHNLNPDVVGISAITRRCYALYKMLAALKVRHVAVGGPHTTYYAKDILKRGANSVFIGNLADFEFNRAINTKPLPTGIIYCNTDINLINYPNRKLIDLNDYFFEGKILFTANHRLPMFSSIGCPHRCTFCNVQSKRCQFKNAKLVVKEMLELKLLGCGSVHILDDNFNASPIHLERVIDELEKVGWNTEWSARGQVKLNPTLIPRLSDLGLKRFHVGIESLDNGILQSFRKQQTLDKITAFCHSMHDHNIDLLAYFVVGSPLETEEYKQTLPSKIRDLHIRYPFFNALYPEPNTEYYKSLLIDNIYKEDIWNKYMCDPVPNFEIPYPYGQDKKLEILNYVDTLIKEFENE